MEPQSNKIDIECRLSLVLNALEEMGGVSHVEGLSERLGFSSAQIAGSLRKAQREGKVIYLPREGVWTNHVLNRVGR